MYYLCWPAGLVFPAFQGYYFYLISQGEGHDSSDPGHHWAEAVVLHFFLILSKAALAHFFPRVKRFFLSGAKERLAQKLRNDVSTIPPVYPLYFLSFLFCYVFLLQLCCILLHIFWHLFMVGAASSFSYRLTLPHYCTLPSFLFFYFFSRRVRLWRLPR